jgi:hypothetical protein
MSHASEQTIGRRDFLRGTARTAAIASISSALGGGLIGWALERGGAAYAGSQGGTIPVTPGDGGAMSVDPKLESARTPQRGGHDFDDPHRTRTPTAPGTLTPTVTSTPSSTLTPTTTSTVTPTPSATPCGPQGPQGPQGICGPQGPQGLSQPSGAIARRLP